MRGRRVVLVGEPGAHGFAAQRLAHFDAALRAAGHGVTVVDARAPAGEAAGEVVVSAGVYGPTATAVAIAGERPLWIDLPGDPWADAQAVVARGGDAAAVTEDCARVFLPALARADAFSTIGAASRWTLIGQLGLLGRWLGPDRLPIHPVPIAWPGGLAAAPRAPGGPVRVLLAGSFNTWFDEDAVADVLEAAMARTPLEVDVLGGPGQPGGYARFQQRMAGRPVRFHGWLADPAPVYAACEVLLTLDRADVWEPGTGSRTRVLGARAAGLRVVASAGPEAVDALAAMGQLRAVRTRGEAIEALLDRAPPPDPSPIAERYDPHRLAASLCAWVAEPTRAPPAPIRAPLQQALDRAARAEAELGRVRSSRTFRLGAWLRRAR